MRPFVVKPRVSSSDSDFDDDEPDTDEPSDQGPTLREHFEEDEDDLPTNENEGLADLDEDDYETVIEPSAVLEALQKDAQASGEEDEEDLDTDVVGGPVSTRSDASRSVARRTNNDSAPPILLDFEAIEDIDGFQAIESAAFAAIDEEHDELDDEPAQPAAGAQHGEDNVATSRSGFSVQVVAAKHPENDTDNSSEDEHTEDEHTDEDDTDDSGVPISTSGHPLDHPRGAGTPQRTTEAVPPAPAMAGTPQLQRSSPEASSGRPGSLVWIGLLGLLALLLVYALQFTGSGNDAISPEPSATPAEPSGEGVEKEAVKPQEHDIQSADDAH